MVSVFFTFYFLKHVQWYLLLALIFISPITMLNIISYAYLPSIYPFWSVFLSFAHFKNCVVWCLTVEFWEFLMYSGSKSFVGYVICKYFLPVYGWSFLSLKIFVLMTPNFLFFSFMFFFFVISNIHPCIFARPASERFSLVFFFSSEYFIVWHLNVWSIFEFLCKVWGLGWGFFFFAYECPVLLTPFVEIPIFLQWNCLCTFVKNQLDILKTISGLSSVPLICVSIHSPTLHCFDFWSFSLNLQICVVWVLQHFWFFKIVLSILVPFSFHINFRFCLLISTYRNPAILILIALIV